MPLSINVGLSRKASQNYQSTGVSINVTAELDSALLAKPGELQQQIDALYDQAEQAIDRQVKAYAGNTTAQTTTRPNNNGNQYRRQSNGNGTGRNRTQGNGHSSAGMTESQKRAIHAIAQRVNADLTRETHDLFGAPLDDLTLKQASELIDHLKTLAPAENGQGRH